LGRPGENKMKYRMIELQRTRAETTNTTRTIDLDIATPISRIVIRMKGTNTTSTPVGHPARMISRIELVDGSDVIYSLTGVEAEALNFIENSELPYNCCEYELPIEVCTTAQLNFGRELWDREFALDPKRFTNLQLKVTNAVGSGGSTAGTCTLAIFAYVFEDSPPMPRGFLMAKELKSYTVVNAQHEYTELPKDYPFRFVILQSYDTNMPPNTIFGNLKFTIDTDRKIILNDISMTEYLKAHIPMDKVEEEFGGLGTAALLPYYLASTYNNYGVAVGRSANSAALFVAQPAGQTMAVLGNVGVSFACMAVGYCAFGAMNLVQADKMDPTSWLDPRGTMSVKLDITGGGAGTAYIIAQQARTYS